MKSKLLLYTLLLSLVGGISACDMESLNQSSFDSSVIYASPTLTQVAVMGIHQTFVETNSYRGRYLPYYGINTDIEWRNTTNLPKGFENDAADLYLYQATPTNALMNSGTNAYAKFYEGIERANQAIEGIRNYGHVGMNREMAYLLGEALTLRAVLYLDLVKGWGDVPASFDTSLTASELIYSPPTDRDIIYKQLLDDLEEASELVPWPNETRATQSTERVSKAFTKGLRARIALYAAGYAQRKEGIRLSNDKALNRHALYTLVKEECLEVIESGTTQLGSFLENFKKLCQEDVQAGGESIWEIPFSDGRGRVLYTYGVKHQRADQYTQQPQGGIIGPLPYLFYDYDVADVRRDITCVPYEWSGLTDGKSKQQPRSLKSWCFGKLRYEWMGRSVTSMHDDGVNWQYMRLADIYLMAAEVINELEGPTAAAAYLLPILQRALPLDKVTNYMNQAIATQKSFFQAIVAQRAFEFAGESLRKADLIRWNLLETKLKEAQQKMRQLARREGAYANLPERIYYQTAPDGESLLIYGLNHGDSDKKGQNLGYASSKPWISTQLLPDALIDNLYMGLPNKNQYWPIWAHFSETNSSVLQN